MSTEFPYVHVPAELEPLIGIKDGDSRNYRKQGTQDEAAAWHELVYRVAGRTVSPGGVLMYCPASRAAVYKRMKEGKLTAFNYYPSDKKTKLFGGLLVQRAMPYCYIPVSEAKAWRIELEERAVALGKITQSELEESRKKGVQADLKIGDWPNAQEEFEGIKPDWHADFLEWNSKWHKEQMKKRGKK